MMRGNLPIDHAAAEVCDCGEYAVAGAIDNVAAIGQHYTEMQPLLADRPVPYGNAWAIVYVRHA